MQKRGAGSTLQAQPVQAMGEGMQALFKPLEHINAEAVSLEEHAQAAMAAGNDMTPGEMVMLTVRRTSSCSTASSPPTSPTAPPTGCSNCSANRPDRLP